MDEAFDSQDRMEAKSAANDSLPCELELRYPLLRSMMAGGRNHQASHDQLSHPATFRLTNRLRNERMAGVLQHIHLRLMCTVQSGAVWSLGSV
jgi:hypothetical protein